jgi:hypothetical protein
MSYDLFLQCRDGTYDGIQFLEFFHAREWYKVRGNQAWYENEDTGVYFSYELSEPSEKGDPPQLPISLNVNFFRPSYFIAEVEAEVTALVHRFDMVVFDPQINGMGEGEYQKELLIAGWNLGNEFAFSRFLKDPEDRAKLLSMPSAKLRQIWMWNRERRARQAQCGDSKFVPRICFIRLDEDISSAVVWPDGIPSVIPPVDRLLVIRQELAPRRLFRRVEDRALLAWQDALPMFERYGSRQPDDAISLDYDRPPGEVAGFIRSLPGGNQEVATVSADQVLDRELVDKYSRTAP